jgi:hypothetical protein
MWERRGVWALIFFQFIAWVSAQTCPSRCSGHGACGAEGVCICETGWTLAADCSLRVRILFFPIDINC